MGEIFDELNDKLFIVDLENAFKKKNIRINECKYDIKEGVATIFTRNGDKIVVECHSSKITWKLNALNMGEVIGNDICDVAGEYEVELAKER